MAMMQPPGEPEFATKQDVQRIEQDVQAVRQDVQRVEQRVERVEQRLERVEQRVERVDEKVERVGEQLHGLKKKFERMEEKLDAVLTVMREHMASRSDVERMARVFAMWLGTATLAAVVAVVSRT